jgi:hypothetical protein
MDTAFLKLGKAKTANLGAGTFALNAQKPHNVRQIGTWSHHQENGSHKYEARGEGFDNY